MTYQKTGTEFWDECAMVGPTDAAVRTHAEAIGWLYRIESDDLRIPKQLVRRFAGVANGTDERSLPSDQVVMLGAEAKPDLAE